MTSVLIKGKFGHWYIIKEVDVKRHREKAAIYKPERERLERDSSRMTLRRNQLC